MFSPEGAPFKVYLPSGENQINKYNAMIIKINNKAYPVGKDASVQVHGMWLVVRPNNCLLPIGVDVANNEVASFLGELIMECLSDGEDVGLEVSQD